MTSAPDATNKGHKEPLVRAGETVLPQESSQRGQGQVAGTQTAESAPDATAFLKENVEQDIQAELAMQRGDEDKENDPSEVQEIGSKRKEPSGITISDVHGGAFPPTESCDVVRRKIRTFIESGEMKVGEFCNAIGVSNGAYNNFLKKNGPHKGEDCAAYFNAFAFFKKQQQEGLKMPKKKKQKTSPEKGEEADGGKEGGKKVLHADDLSDIHLEGEDTDKVMVFETCDEIRRQISAWLRKPGVTQASLLRDMASQFSDSAKSISASQLQSFRGKKGPESGNSSAVFYGAYVFFEKARIKEGKPKSERRKKMEEIWGPKGGFDRTLHASGITCRFNERPTFDEYGQLHFIPI